MSGDLGGHCSSGWSFADARPIQHCVKVLMNLTVEVLGLPSCWNMKVGTCFATVLCPAVFL